MGELPQSQVYHSINGYLVHARNLDRWARGVHALAHRCLRQGASFLLAHACPGPERITGMVKKLRDNASRLPIAARASPQNLGSIFVHLSITSRFGNICELIILSHPVQSVRVRAHATRKDGDSSLRFFPGLNSRARRFLGRS